MTVDGSYCAARAEELRAAASAEARVEVRDQLLRLANDFDRLAMTLALSPSQPAERPPMTA
jgi:hypothetical protein